MLTLCLKSEARLNDLLILYWYRNFIFHNDFKYLWKFVLFIYSVLEEKRLISLWNSLGVVLAEFTKNKRCSECDS